MNNKIETARIIKSGRAVMGMELGSTRIKAVLAGPDNQLLAVGGYAWENEQQDGIWTYSLEKVWEGIAAAFSNLKKEVEDGCGAELNKLAMAGFSAMMHGYLVFNSSGELLVPFRTWRNNITAQASGELTEVLEYPIPQRWSVAHFHQALLNGEEHVPEAAFLTTLIRRPAVLTGAGSACTTNMPLPGDLRVIWLNCFPR